MISNKPLLFTHIPRAAGTSIVASLGGPRIRHVPYNKNSSILQIRHEPLSLLATLNNLDDFFKFAIVRNPYTRAYSLYKSAWAFRAARNFPPKPLNATNVCLERDTTFTEFLKRIKARFDQVDDTDFSFPTTRFLCFLAYSQTFFVTDKDNNILSDKIYHHENLSEYETDFNRKLSMTNNMSYTSEDYYADYTLEAIDLVKEIYEKDFNNFGYSFDFK